MGIGFVILFYSFAYIVLAALLSLIAWPIRALFNRRPKLKLALRIAPFIIPAVPPVVGLGAVVWANFEPPRYVYRSVFDRLPDSTIIDLHGQSSGFNDDREAFLSFRDSDSTFYQALAATRFELINPKPYDNLVPLPGDSQPPDWWTAARCIDRAIYIAKNVRGWNEIVLTRCHSDATIYVQARWID